ncbi:hypothetical protein RUND412_009643 [Rhizina undulata]
MRFQFHKAQLLAALSLPFAVAFEDTSPHFIISSSNFDSGSPSQAYMPIEAFVNVAEQVVGRCESDAYILANQPGLHATDFYGEGSAPQLKKVLDVAGASRSLVVANGFKTDKPTEETVEQLLRFAMEKCDAKVEEVDAKTGAFPTFSDMKPKIIRVELEELPEAPGKERRQAVAQNDAFLHSILSLLPTSKYTLIYTSTPLSAAAEIYEQQQHELKRDLAGSTILRRQEIDEEEPEEPQPSNNSTLTNGNLFTKYQFFTPAFFMAYIAAFFLLTVLYIAMSAVSSLQVPYGAFEKEMGPAAAKKQQQ